MVGGRVEVLWFEGVVGAPADGGLVDGEDEEGVAVLDHGHY